MKGPFQRLKYDLRRLWECPVCKRRERTSGSVTYRHCSCQMKQLDGKPVVMRLIADDVQHLMPPGAVHHEPPHSTAPVESGTATSPHPPDNDSPKPEPSN
jgi:hypothetical protein